MAHVAVTDCCLLCYRKSLHFVLGAICTRSRVWVGACGLARRLYQFFGDCELSRSGKRHVAQQLFCSHEADCPNAVYCCRASCCLNLPRYPRDSRYNTVSSHAADWFEALILIVYAYGGFESALFPSGEARDPRKDAPIALCVAVVTATFLYVALQYVVIHILPHAAATSTPAADVAKRLLGSLGASLLTAGILVSLYGSLSANMLETPRLTFAMGEQGDFPKFFAAIHPRFRSPHLSIAAFALLLTAFSIGGTFRGNAILSAGSRLFVYAATAAALPVLRRKHPSADAFRLPFGIAFSVLALVFTGLLVARIQIRDLIVIAAAFTVGTLNWLWARRIPSAPSVLGANGVESGL
jgi:amino acid transporter